MPSHLRRFFCPILLLAVLLPAARAMAGEAGGPLCLFEIPDQGQGKRKLINLTIVQYVEITRDELRIYYGGGSFGSGHEERIPLAKPDDAKLWLERMRKTSADCK